MSFLNPGFLYLLPLVALPFIIHLFAAKVQRRAKFSWVRLLRSAQYEGKKRRRLLEILILILRSLAILSLIMLAARPFRGELFKFRYLVVDFSPSSRHDTSKIFSIAEKVKGKGLDVYFLDDRLYEKPVLYDMPANFKKLGSLEKPAIILSDFQSSNVSDFRDTSFLAVKLRPPRDELKILGVRVQPGITMQGFEASLKVFLKATRRMAVRLNLYREEKLIAGGNFEVNPDSVNQLNLKFIPEKGGIWKAEILPLDELPEDNVRYFNLTVLERLRVGIIGNNKFIARALNPFRIKNYPVQVTEDIQANFAGFDVIFLTNPDIPLERLIRVIRYVESGGNLVIFTDKITAPIINALGLNIEPVESAKVVIEKDTLTFPRAIAFGDGKAILRDSKGRKIAVIKPFSKGRLVLVGLPADVSETLFPISPAFVPFVYSLLERLFNVKTNTRVTTAGTPCISIIDSNPTVITPEGEKVACKDLNFPKVGFYRGEWSFGVNLPPSEAEGRFLSDRELDDHFKAHTSLENFENMVRSSRSFTSIFVYFLIFYVLIESLILGWKFRL